MLSGGEGRTPTFPAAFLTKLCKVGGGEERSRTHAGECYLAIRKRGVLQCVTTWGEHGGLGLSEMSQAEQDKWCPTSLTCGISHNKTRCQTRWGSGLGG